MNDKVSKENIENIAATEEEKLLAEETAPVAKKEAELSEADIDTVGEVGNIFMGAASTTLAQLLGKNVNITTPEVKVFKSIKDSYIIDEDHLTVEITYEKGLPGTAVLALKTNDSAILADLMMGGKGEAESTEISELQISAIGEAMNQMVGTASTALSNMLNTQIGISPPVIKILEKGKDIELNKELLENSIVAIKFKLIIEEVVDSEIIQFMTVVAAKAQVKEVKDMMESMSKDLKENLKSDSVVETIMKEAESRATGELSGVSAPGEAGLNGQVTVQPVQFSSFDKTSNIFGETNRNLNLVLDVKLGLTVELGRTTLPIKNVLELTRGSIIELDKVAGEPVELFANGKLIAKGEVVVIEDNFGLRITSIVSPEQRIKDL